MLEENLGTCVGGGDDDNGGLGAELSACEQDLILGL